jgi:1-deoxy-D-xylulose-5-phosphate reductoisomerase
MPAVLNAADEIAVEAYLQDKIRFTDIARIIEITLAAHRSGGHLPSLVEIVEVDQWARRKAQEAVENVQSRCY